MAVRLVFFALLAIIASALNAEAAGTTLVPVTSSAFADLGPAPVAVATPDVVVQIVVSDTQPSSATTTLIGSRLSPGPAQIFYQADASSHVWAQTTGVAFTTSLAVTPISAALPGGPVTAISGAFVDCAIATLGCETDTANAATGHSLMAATRQIDADINVLAGLVATAAKQPTLNGDGGAPAHVTNFPSVQSVSVSFSALPSGAATAAGQHATGTGAYSPVTIGTSDSTILAASTAMIFLDLVNDSPTATICLNFGSTATISGTQCPAGEIALPPLWHRSWEGTFVPSDAIHAIASAASTAGSVGVK